MKIDWVELGVLAASKQPADWSDVAMVVHDQHIGVIISLTEQTLFDLLPFQAKIPWARYRHFPVPDGQPPSLEQLLLITDFINVMSSRAIATLVHCREGIGRTGTVLCYYYMKHGYTFEQAEAKVQAAHPIALTPPQREFLAGIV